MSLDHITAKMSERFRNVGVLDTVFAFSGATCCANVARLSRPTMPNVLPVMQGEPVTGKAGSSVNSVLNFDIYLGPHSVSPDD
jgi:hypothetical protein